MSLNKKKIVAGTVGALALITGAFVASGGIASTSADFSASDQGKVTMQTGTLTIELSDSDQVGQFTLDYANLAPGDVKVDTFTVKNTGSIKADVKVGAPFSSTSANIGQANLGRLNLAIDGYKPPTAVNNPALLSGVDLGSLNPGQSRTYVVRVGLDQSAGNEWQGKSVATNVTVTLQQS